MPFFEVFEAVLGYYLGCFGVLGVFVWSDFVVISAIFELKTNERY
jgi:hypothetical protein